MEETLRVSWFICLNSISVGQIERLNLIHRTCWKGKEQLFTKQQHANLVYFIKSYLLYCRLKLNLLCDASMCQTGKPCFIWEIQIIELDNISLWPLDLIFTWFKVIMCLSDSWSSPTMKSKLKRTHFINKKTFPGKASEKWREAAAWF